MIEQLFGSKTRVKLLQLFYKNPNRSFYVREITRKIDEQINSVRRELANMLSIGIITSDNTNNKLYYEVDQSFEHHQALSSMFAGKMFKEEAPSSKKATKATQQQPKAVIQSQREKESQDPFIQNLLKTGNVRLALYTGQFTRDSSAGVDMLIVGDVNQSAVERLIAEFEAAEKKDIKYSIFDIDEFKYRKEVNDRFISKIESAKKIILVDKDNLL